MSETVPVGFLMILLGGFIAALVLVLILYALKRRRISRIQSPRKDYFK